MYHISFRNDKELCRWHRLRLRELCLGGVRPCADKDLLQLNQFISPSAEERLVHSFRKYTIVKRWRQHHVLQEIGSETIVLGFIAVGVFVSSGSLRYISC